MEKIIHMLELSGEAPKGMLRARTLSDYFRKEGISRQDLREKNTGVYRKFQKPHRNSMWQGDTQTTLYLPDPNNPSRKKKVYLMAFLWKEDRTVDKTGCISLNANLYEVDPSLAKQKVYLLYNPFDLKEIEVFKDNKSFGMAQPLSVTRDIHKDAQSVQESSAPSTGINYLTLLKQTYDDKKKQELKLSFKSLQEMVQQKEENHK